MRERDRERETDRDRDHPGKEVNRLTAGNSLHRDPRQAILRNLTFPERFLSRHLEFGVFRSQFVSQKVKRR